MQHMPEWRIFIIVFLGMLLCIVLAEVFRKLLKLSPEFSRKFVHVSIGLIIFFLPKIFIHAFPLLVLGLIFILVNSIALRKEWLSGMHGTDRHSFGTVLYPVSFVLLVLFFWDRHPEIAAIAMLVMALGDGTAAIIGEALPSPHFYRLSSDKKSIEGSAVMFLVSFACVFGGLVFYVRDGFSRQMFLPVSLVVALAAAAWEALSSGGWDNCTVPLSSGLILACFLIPGAGIDPLQIIIGTAFGMCIGGSSWKAKFLSPSGAVATFLLAVIIFGMGGWKWAAPILFFFFISSLLSKLGKKGKEEYELLYKKSSVRDYEQVAANGGIGGFLIILHIVFPSYDFYPLYVGSIAAVTADTWGSEIGLLRKTKTYSLTSWNRVEQGSNGGVSFIGFIGGCLGSSLLSALAYIWVQNLKVSVFIALSGVLGSAVDSILGGTLQAAFKCTNCKKITEKKIHCGLPANHTGGFIWIDNEIVNYCCALTGCLIMALLL